MTQFIIEVANTHGGDINYLKSLIEEFEEFKDFGMKFQPLHPDHIATADYEWYSVYEELLFNKSEWEDILTTAHASKKVWLDLFDTYGVEILKANLNIVYGIKLQASILYNYEVINELEELDCTKLKLILNVSAIEMEDIAERVAYFQDKVQPQELLIEVGFQSYPTALEDAGLVKIQYVKSEFNCKVVFADHVDGKQDDAIVLPLLAVQAGADYIEKHVMHSTLETKYDHFSSVTRDQFAVLVQKEKAYSRLYTADFINDKERVYLQKSIQKPILKRLMEKGCLVDVRNDLSFKRNTKLGLSVNEIGDLQKGYHILANDCQQGETLLKEQFRRATIATVIAGRLKSSRLKRKALLKIGTLTSVEKCIQSCLQFKDTNYTILATSTEEEDNVLKDYTFHPSVRFHQGDPDDVIKRYLDALDSVDVDVIIRVTADMPYVSAEIAEYLLQAHFRTGADYTAARAASVGTAPEIINVQALKEVKRHFPNADYSEYMTWYFQNNQEHFKVNLVDLPSSLIRDYRLTIDYQEDLDMMNKLQSYLDQNGLPVTAGQIFQFLDDNPKVAAINGHIGLKYKTDQELIQTLNRVTKIK